MIHTIIVDDEFLVRLGLKNMAAWENNGFEIVGEASDGIKALEICRNQQVDLVVTDIEMPKMNGIELIHALHQEMPHISIIVLSNHRNSEYIRETLRYNRALDYIFKLALDENELEMTLKNIRTTVENSSANTILAINESYIKPLLKEKQEAWNLFLQDGIFKDTYAGLFETDFSVPFYCIYIQLWRKNDGTLPAPADKLSLVESMFSDTFAKEQLKIDILLSDKEKCFVAFLEAHKDNSEQIIERCKKIKYANSLFQDSPLAFGISQPLFGINNVTLAKQQAFQALELSFFHNKPEINIFQQVPAPSNITIISRHQLAFLIHNKNTGEIHQALEQYLQQCIAVPCGNAENVKDNCFDFIMLLSSLLKENFGSVVSTIRHDTIAPLIKECLSIDALLEVLSSSMDTLFSEYHITNSQIISKDVQKAMYYIQTNYDKNFRLKDVADYIGMSESYLSYLFKKELGKNLTMYLNEYRIQIAKQLIISSSSTLNLIAEQVGYTNYPYFSKVFRSVVGIEASKFKSIYEKKMISLQPTDSSIL